MTERCVVHKESLWYGWVREVGSSEVVFEAGVLEVLKPLPRRVYQPVYVEWAEKLGHLPWVLRRRLREGTYVVMHALHRGGFDLRTSYEVVRPGPYVSIRWPLTRDVEYAARRGVRLARTIEEY